MSAPNDPVSNFLSKYHLWSIVIFLCLLGVRDSVSYAVWSWYELRKEIDELSYTYKAHHLENERNFEQRASSSK